MNWVLSTVKAVSKRQDCSLSLSVNDESSPHNRENTCYRDRIILVPGQFLWSWPTGNHCPGGRVLGCKWEGLASWGMCACAWWLRGMPLQWSLLQYVHPTPWQNPSADLVLPSAPSCTRCSWCAKLSESSAGWCRHKLMVSNRSAAQKILHPLFLNSLIIRVSVFWLLCLLLSKLFFIKRPESFI